MTITEKLISALRYMFKPVMIFYWLGATLAFLLLFYFFLDASFQMQSAQLLDIILNPEGMGELFDNLYREIVFSCLIIILLFLAGGKSIDSAKQISEGNMNARSFSPVARIGWQGVFKYTGAYILIILVWDIFSSILSFVVQRKLNYDLNIDALSLNIYGNDLNHIALILPFMVLFMIVSMSCSLVFLETLSFFAMINPERWLEKLKRLGIWNVIIILIIGGLIPEVIYALLTKLAIAIPGQYTAFFLGIYFLAEMFLMMFSVIWLGYFVDDGLSATTDG